MKAIDGRTKARQTRGIEDEGQTGGLDEGVSGGVSAREVVMLTLVTHCAHAHCPRQSSLLSPAHNDGIGGVFPQTAGACKSLPQKPTISYSYYPPLFVTGSKTLGHAHSTLTL